MNYSIAVFLLTDAARAISCHYEADEPGRPPAKRELFKSFDPDIKVGDLVIVESGTRHKVTTVKVEAVDVDFDISTQVDVKWIIGRVALADYDEIKRKEAAAITAIQQAEMAKKRAEMKKTLMGDFASNLAGLEIVTEYKAIAAPSAAQPPEKG